MTRTRLGVWLVAMLIAGTAAPAEEAPATWQRLYVEGIRLESEGRWRQAMEQFERAASLRPEPEAAVPFGPLGTLDYDPYVRIARCALEDDAPAFVVRRALERSGRAGVTPRPELKRLAERLARRTIGERRPGLLPDPTPGSQPTAPPPAPTAAPSPSRIRLVDLPAGATVTLDGRPLPPGATRVEVAPGSHGLAVSLDGTPLVEQRLELAPGEVLTLVVPAVPPTPEPTATVIPTPSPPPTAVSSERGARPRPRRAVLAAALLTLVAALVGTAVTLRARRRRGALEVTPTQRLAVVPGGAAGRELGGYRLVERLGAGGMATTWRALRLGDGREVAVKLPHEHCLDDPRFRARFLREGRLGTQLHHPNIVRLLEAGEVDGQPYLAMELVPGRTLRELVRTAGALPLERALDVARQVAEALDYAHSKGVVHRDLKPENLMLRQDGEVLVMDFGIARVDDGAGLTTTSVFMGTPTYAAPEAIAGEPCDGRQDLYALGLILYEMLAGGPPFPETTPLELLRRHLEGPPPERERLGRPVPDRLWDAIARLTARRPEDRFPDAESVLVALHGLRQSLEDGTL